MSRKAWGSVMLFSLGVAVGSGYFLIQGLHKPAGPASEVPMPAPAPIVVSSPEKSKAAEPAPASVASISDDKIESERSKSKDKKDDRKRRILFSLPKPMIKSAAITGDFNKWKPQKMTKNGKAWQVTVELEPGTYKYMFVADGREIRDPNGKKSPDGKSLVTVKPLASAK